MLHQGLAVNQFSLEDELADSKLHAIIGLEIEKLCEENVSIKDFLPSTFEENLAKDKEKGMYNLAFNPDYAMWLATLDNRPVGFAISLKAGKRLDTENFYVLPEFRENNVAKKMKEAQIDFARQNGFKELFSVVKESDVQRKACEETGHNVRFYDSNRYHATLYFDTSRV